jgi:ADP-heptose:LPS heptosyltransferase
MFSFLSQLPVTIYGFLLRVAAGLLKGKAKTPRTDSRILCLTDGGVSDMVYALPLFHAIRRHHLKSHLTVACTLAGEPVALACPAVNDVIVLDPGWNPWQAAYRNAAFLQNYDWVVAVKGNFDRRQAVLTRLTNAAVRIGFEKRVDRPSLYFTDPVALPAKDEKEHHIETLLRLLKPLGLVKATALTVDFNLHLPDTALAFAAEMLAVPPFDIAPRFMLMNLSSPGRLLFREEDFIATARQVLSTTEFAIGLVASAADMQKAREIAMCMNSKRIVAIETPGPMELAAVMTKAAFLVTPEGETAHLAAAVGTAAVVLWSDSDFEKWRSRGRRHVFVQAEPRQNIPAEEVWKAMQPFLVERPPELGNEWGDFVELPPSSDFVP